MTAFPKYLSQTERLFEAIRRDILHGYDILKAGAYIDEFCRGVAADINWQELVRPSIDSTKSSPGAQYLQELIEVIGPPIQVAGIYVKLGRVSPRKDGLRRHRSLESLIVGATHESYRFKERLKAVSRALNVDEDIQRIGRAIRKYNSECKDIIAIRNSFVHGRKTACKELQDLDGFEICALTMHDDIWLEYRNAFEEVRSNWRSRTKRLLGSMEAALLQVNVAHACLGLGASNHFTAHAR